MKSFSEEDDYRDSSEKLDSDCENKSIFALLDFGSWSCPSGLRCRYVMLSVKMIKSTSSKTFSKYESFTCENIKPEAQV